MVISGKDLSEVLLGTTQRRWATAGLHVAFWLVYARWFGLEGAWLAGAAHPLATWLLGGQAALLVVPTFYAVSAAGRRARPSQAVWLRVLGLLLLSFGLYGWSTYYLYQYLATTYPDMPAPFLRLYGNISQQGPWTFLTSDSRLDILYYYASRLLLVGFLPFALLGGRALVRARVRTLVLENDNLHLELNALRAQINPHFLFNTLNSVYALVEEKDQTAATLVLSLASMMRYALYEAVAPQVALAQELAFIREYLAIQQIRHQRRLRLELHLAADLGRRRIPPLLLVTFLENAVKHGVDQLLHEAWVRVQAYQDEAGSFCFAVSNARPPMAGPDPPAEGIGLRNTRRRLALLYPATHALLIHTEPTRYHVLLRLWQ